jgi:hypothetical protein
MAALGDNMLTVSILLFLVLLLVGRGHGYSIEEGDVLYHGDDFATFPYRLQYLL